MYGSGRVAVVDDADYGLVSQYRWLARRGRNETYYAIRFWQEDSKVRSQFMHTLLTGLRRTDHINHDGLDNRRRNLRDGTGPRNAWNTRKFTVRSSRYKGVCWDAGKQKWMVRVSIDGRARVVGRFASEIRAARAYDRAARESYGEYAFLNFPDLASDAPDLEPPEPDRSNKGKTHCKYGHEFTPENTYLFRGRNGRTYRACRECRRSQ